MFSAPKNYFKTLLTAAFFIFSFKAFSFCGPNTVQYMPVDSSLYAPHEAVMCVLIVDDNSYAFYTEGRVRGKTFRTLGYIRREGALAGRSNILSGYNYSLNGSSEEDTGYPATAMHLIHDFYQWNKTNPPQVIVESNNRATVWKRALVEYQPQGLPPLTSCGSNFKTLRLAGRPNDIRCVLKYKDNNPGAWIGSGVVNGISYLHLGTAFFAITGPQYGTADLCLPGHYCASNNFGALSISPRPSSDGKTHFFVTGAWTETWIEQ